MLIHPERLDRCDLDLVILWQSIGQDREVLDRYIT